ncbi:MAG: cell division protein FtsZ, partial [Pseudonocardiaceae bacterium]
LITTPGLINLDFADVKSVMSGAGSALMGIGSSRGEGRSVQAAEKAINSPLLEASMEGAHGVLLSIAGGSDLGLFEINEAATLVQESAHPDANIIFGTVIDDSLGDEVRVTVIAAGFDTGGPSHKKLNPSPVAARTVASGQSGKVGQSSRSPQAPMSAPAAATPPRQAAPQPNNTAWQPATGARRLGGAAPGDSASGRPGASRSGRAIPVTGDFDDDDEVDVPPFMRR